MKVLILMLSMAFYNGDIENLGAKKYKQRREAYTKLLSAGYWSIPAISKASIEHKDLEIRRRCEEIQRKYFLNIFGDNQPPRICMLCLSREMNYSECPESSAKVTEHRQTDWGFSSVYSPKRNLLGIISERIMRNYYSNDDDFKDEELQRTATERVVYKLCIDNPFPADIMKKLISRMQHLDKNWEFGD